MPKPDFLDLPFDEAIQYFRQKIPIPTEKWSDFTASQHDWAFTIAGLTKAELLEDARSLVDKAIAEGMDLEDFKKEFQQQIGQKGWNPGGARIETILSTNVRRAHSAGRYQQATDPDVVKKRNLWLWRHRDSPQPRPNHKALHNVAIPADNDFWKVAYPSCAFGCKCSAFSITEEYAKRKGIKILTNPPDPMTIAEPGFQRAPGLSDQSDRAQVLADGVARLSPELQEKVRADLTGKGILPSPDDFNA